MSAEWSITVLALRCCEHASSASNSIDATSDENRSERVSGGCVAGVRNEVKDAHGLGYDGRLQRTRCACDPLMIGLSVVRAVFGRVSSRSVREIEMMCVCRVAVIRVRSRVCV